MPQSVSSHIIMCQLNKTNQSGIEESRKSSIKCESLSDVAILNNYRLNILFCTVAFCFLLLYLNMSVNNLHAFLFLLEIGTFHCYSVLYISLLTFYLLAMFIPLYPVFCIQILYLYVQPAQQTLRWHSTWVTHHQWVVMNSSRHRSYTTSRNNGN